MAGAELEARGLVYAYIRRGASTSTILFIRRGELGRRLAESTHTLKPAP